MSWSSRRASAVVAVLALVSILTGMQPVLAQVRMGIKRPFVPPPPSSPTLDAGSGDPTDLGGITVTADEGEKVSLEKRIKAAKDNIALDEPEAWGKAVAILQDLLDRDEDVFVPVTHDLGGGKTVKSITSVRAEASRLIGNLPPRAMEFYKVQVGARADEDLKIAKDNEDTEMLARIMTRYLYTDAGAEAATLLATRLLDRGQYSTAALCFEKLFQRQGPDKLPPSTLFKATIAFKHAGDKVNLAKAWKHLEGKTNKVRLGEKQVEVADLKEWVGKRKSEGITRETWDWLMPGGYPARNAQGVGTTAFLEPLWKHNTFLENSTKSLIDTVVKEFEDKKQPLLHGFSPLAVTVSREDGKVPLMVYRSFWGIHARAVRTVSAGKEDECKAGEIYWEAPSAWSVDRMALEPRYVGQLNQWTQLYVVNQKIRPQALFENSTVGSLSSDNVRVYAVDDLQITPPYNQFNPLNRGGGVGVGPAGPLNDALMHNRLQAYDLDSGKLLWEVGSREDRVAPHPLHDTYFLGPPLPLNGKLYALVEKNQELRLACLDAASGRLVARPQRLADAREKILQDSARRTYAAHLAYGEGILVCPTNAGGVLGFDLLSNSLVWAYGYREKGYTSTTQVSDPRFGQPPLGQIFLPTGQLAPAPTPSTTWKATPPVIVQGRVVFTAPDAAAVHCLSLRDGSRQWKHPRQEGDLYLAGVYSGKVVIVGKQYVRGLSLADGAELWRVETGMPSGIGIASKDIYYLPLKAAAKTREPEICLIDVNKGNVLAHTRSRKKEVPGNLLFYEGDVLSQGLAQVAAYPQLEVELKRIDRLLTDNPNSPEGLVRRGDLRLDKGDLGGAIKDLRTALANKDTPKLKLSVELEAKARGKLYESLTQYFQDDFEHAQEYIKEYEGMCAVVTPGMEGPERKKAQEEEIRRKGTYYCLVGKGREKQAREKKGTEARQRLLEAFEAYMSFGALGQANQELRSSIDDPGVKAAPAVWSRGRIAAMLASVDKDKSAPLEALIAKRYAEVKKTAGTDALRGFVSTFGDMTAVGREARFQLAERLLNDTGGTSLVDAERHLELLRVQTADPQMAARAVEALARLMTRKGLMDDATHYYRVLGRDFATVVVKDGKTGLDFFNDLATDKRLLPYLDETPPLLGAKVSMENVKEERGPFPYTGAMLKLEQEGEKLPFFKRYSLNMRTDYHQLKVLDRDTAAEFWSQNLTNTQLQTFIQQRDFRFQHVQARVSFKTLGHLVVLPLGHMVFALDPVSKQVLWEKNLTGSNGMPNYVSHTIDPRDGSVQVVYKEGWTQRLGQSGPLSPTAACLLTSEALVAVDPVKGDVLWMRSDMPKKCHLYNDAQHIFVVEMGDAASPGATRVFRLHDGVDIHARDFSAAYKNRVRMTGHKLLVRDSDATGITLRLYDVLAGKDLWKNDFPAGTLVLQSADENLGGVVEPNGNVTVLDLAKAKVVLKARMKAEHLAKVTDVHLLRDRNDTFIACNGPADASVLAGSLTSNLMPNTGLRGLPVNGALYSFDDKGTLNWFNEVQNQMIVLDEFAELPVVILTSRYRKWVDQFRGQAVYVVAIRSYDKKTGKLILRLPNRDEESGNYQQFYALAVDARAGKIELKSANLKIVYSLFGGDGGGGAGPKKEAIAPPKGSTTAAPPPGIFIGKVKGGRVGRLPARK